MKAISLAITIVMIALGCSTKTGADPANAERTFIAPRALDGETVTWHDGNREYTLWVNPNIVAEFTEAADRSEVFAEQPKAKLVSHYDASTTVRLWQLDNDELVARVSPVFHEGPHTQAPIRALPGGAVVHLDPNWGADEITIWASDLGVEIERELPGPNTVVIKTHPGFDALVRANALRDSAGVVHAYPNWWRPLTRR